MEIDLYGWMPEENRITLEKLIKENNVRSVIEIGCFLGLSTKFFVEQGCKVFAIDTFLGSKDINQSEEVRRRLPTLYEQFVFNMDALGIKESVEVLRMSSDQAFKFSNLKADLVYIDGSHEYGDVVNDIDMWFGRANKIICGDDYTDVHDGVRRAVDELLPNANKSQRVWFLIKQ